MVHGQVIELLVANRRTAPAPLWQVDDCARELAVEEVFGIEPELLIDAPPLARHLNDYPWRTVGPRGALAA
ncbi:hypothetical protein [Streptomyces sp. NBC_01590]|uniref:hypothetical protein n=1 Tax=Streptomyces sp. NBC_01590 TaxID=2975887 RepID=UPI003865618C